MGDITYKEDFDASLCNLVVPFGSTEIVNDPALYKNIQGDYPYADVLMSSKAAEIYDTQVSDNRTIAW